MKLPISVIILTCNEELNLENCLKSIKDWVGEIFIVDSYSTDGTKQIAKRYGAQFAEHKFENQAQQFNWALANLSIKTEWIFRLDADEWVTNELWKEIAQKLTTTSLDISGFYIKRRIYFMGRWIKHGGIYPTWILRLFRKGKARSEIREMDEHLVIKEGGTGRMQHDFVDENHKGLEIWTERQNKYSTRDARQIIGIEQGRVADELVGGPVQFRRWLKQNIFLRWPLFFRVFAYFIYRYFFRLGFLDGKEGMIFHVLHGFWYRFLIDAKIYEYKDLTAHAQSTDN